MSTLPCDNPVSDVLLDALSLEGSRNSYFQFSTTASLESEVLSEFVIACVKFKKTYCPGKILSGVSVFFLMMLAGKSK